jgi:hypothetical protein
LAYSIDGGTTWVNNGTDFVPLNGSCATSSAGTTVASWTSFSVTNPSVLVRIYPYAATAATGTLQVYGMSVIGSLNPVGPLARNSGGTTEENITDLLNNNEMMVIYPNPNSGVFNISLPTSTEGATVTIVDVNGKIVLNNTYSAEEHSINIDLSKNATGIYFVRAIAGCKVFNQQVQLK